MRRRKIGSVLEDQPILEGTGADNWFTPPNLFKEIEDVFGPFTFDAAASEHNTKCAEYLTEKDNGCLSPWRGRVWCNPPYVDLIDWVEKAWNETRGWSSAPGNVEIAVLLLPAQTSTRWWHEFVWPGFLAGYVQLYWVRGKRRFGGQRKYTSFTGSVAIAFLSDQEIERRKGL